LALPADTCQSKEDQRPLTPHGQAKVWFRLLLAMAIPTLFLLIGFFFTR
jgi:hypothetical protein